MSDSFRPTPIAELENVTPEQFKDDIRSKAEPVILRGAIKHWPVLAHKDAESLFAYLKTLDTQKLQPTYIGKDGIKGKFNYEPDLRRQNYEQIPESLSSALDRLLNSTSTDGIYAQSLSVQDHIPGFIKDHPFDLVPETTQPRVWIGTQTTVQTHFDTNENIACAVLGEREVTIFPPDQLAGLYPGPLEVAPGGVMVSLTSLDNPDFKAHPRFEETLKTARRATLKPGDAIYIPYGWWHHIRALSSLNMLVNYWWTDQKAMLSNPHAAMFHAMMCFHHLSPEQAKTWQNMFAHFVFQKNGDPMAHVEESAKGILGGVKARDRKRAIYTMMKTLGMDIGIKL